MDGSEDSGVSIRLPVEGEWLFLCFWDRETADDFRRSVGNPRTYVVHHGLDIDDATAIMERWLVEHTSGKYEIDPILIHFTVRLFDLNDATLFRIRWC